jgi:hypothetical protein
MPSPTNANNVSTIIQHHTLPISTSASVQMQTITVIPSSTTPTPTQSLQPVIASVPAVVAVTAAAAPPPPSAAPSVPSKPLTLARLVQLIHRPSFDMITCAHAVFSSWQCSNSSAPIGLAAVHHAATSLHGYSSGMAPSSSPHNPQNGPSSMPLNSAPTSGGGPSSLLGHAGAMLAETMQPTPQSQPVDFSHAINYVNKIKVSYILQF